VLNKLTDTQKALVFSILVLLAGFLAATSHNKLLIDYYQLTPTLITLFMMLLLTKEGYRKVGWSNLKLHRFGFRYWIPAFVIPIVVLALAYKTAWTVSSDSFNVSAFPSDWVIIITNFLSTVGLNIIFYSLGEEIGWRGYLLSKLLPLGKVKAYLWIALVWAFWHYPYFYLTGFYQPPGNPVVMMTLFTLVLIPMSIILGKLRLRSNSLWPASIFHSSNNAIWEILNNFSISSSPAILLLAGNRGIIPILLYSVVATILLRKK